MIGRFVEMYAVFILKMLCHQSRILSFKNIIQSHPKYALFLDTGDERYVLFFSTEKLQYGIIDQFPIKINSRLYYYIGKTRWNFVRKKVFSVDERLYIAHPKLPYGISLHAISSSKQDLTGYLEVHPVNKFADVHDGVISTMMEWNMSVPSGFFV